MAINALAGIMVGDLTTAEAWYEQLLSRPADGGLRRVEACRRRMDSSVSRQGACRIASVTFLVSDLDDLQVQRGA